MGRGVLSDRTGIPRLVIAGTQSGVGKTTIVSGLLSALRRRNLQVQSYKVGPDYIDPGYHRLASGRPCHNLDSWLMPEERMLSLFAATSQSADIAVVEGVMGLYDGGSGGVASTASIAQLLQAPVILTVSARSAGESVAAVVMGFRDYDPRVRLAGVILNQVGSESHRLMVTEAVERIGVRVLGVIRREESLKVPERHLGLLPVTENEAEPVLAKIHQAIAGQIDIEALIEIAKTAGPLAIPAQPSLPEQRRARIGVAADEAFSFYYPESLRVLEEMGAELVEFSPLNDRQLPAVDGLLFGGGFPEMFLQRLSENQTMLAGLRAAHATGMPILAECGGYMYLTRSVEDFSGRTFAMAGLIPQICCMEKKLQAVGYVEAVACRDHLLGQTGETLRGHEFHFSRMESAESGYPISAAFRFRKKRTGSEVCGGYAADNLVASYLHIHFAGNPAAARRFVDFCAAWRQEREARHG